MKNFIQDGDTLVVAAPSPGVVSGQYIRVGAFAGVCTDDAATGLDVAIVREGVFSLNKVTGQAWAVGDPLYWDPAVSKFTNIFAAGVIPAGIAQAAALSADATGNVNIETAASGSRVVSGQFTTVSASDTVITGLSKVIGVVASMDTDPADDPEWASASIGDQNGAPAAGSILIKTWKNTGGTDPTPLAATTFTKKVNWIAFGI